MKRKGGKPNPGTKPDRRLGENKPDIGKKPKPAQDNPAPKKPKKV